MTDIEVAIRFFNGWKNRDEEDRKILPQNTIAYNAYTKEIEYLELAIKALKQMETLEQEPCEDYISRQAVVDTIYHECSGENLDIDFVKVLLLQRKIKALLSVNPHQTMCEEREKGECPFYAG